MAIGQSHRPKLAIQVKAGFRQTRWVTYCMGICPSDGLKPGLAFAGFLSLVVYMLVVHLEPERFSSGPRDNFDAEFLMQRLCAVDSYQ